MAVVSVFGWDYPPGVTGNEPQIAGWPECPACGDEFDGAECEGCGFVAPGEEEACDARGDE